MWLPSQPSPSPDFFLINAPPAPSSCAATVTFDSYSLNPSNTIEFGLGTMPILAATPRLPPPPSAAADIEIWQHNQGQNTCPNSRKPPNSNLPQNDINLQFGRGIAESSTATCQDCGNQAKKDCNHRRCRTCCKSRGYNCPTHVKSTWVPTTRRGTKKPRHSGASQTTLTIPLSNPISSHEDPGEVRGSLPEKVRAPAVFKCVRVTAVDDAGEYGYAYQAVVTINGHVFKGFLYDQGGGVGVGGREGLPDFSQLQIGGGGGGGGGAARHVGNPCSNLGVSVNPNDSIICGASTLGFLGGNFYEAMS